MLVLIETRAIGMQIVGVAPLSKRALVEEWQRQSPNLREFYEAPVLS
jgi:hypothetical protein